jgi:hypothetical protein
LAECFLETREEWIAAGLIEHEGSTSYSECPHCGPGSMGRVHPVLNRRSGTVSLWLPCRDCGLVEIPEASLRIWRLNLDRFTRALAGSLGVRGELDSLAEGSGWFLGRGKWAKRSHELFLLRAVLGTRIPALRERLDRHPRGVILMATPEDAQAWRPHGTQTLILLEEVLSFGNGFVADVELIEAALQPEPSKPPTTRSRRGNRLSQIERLKRELAEHLRAAKRYAYDQEERFGVARLLERPGKSELGERTELQPYEVSRCFNDPAGAELVFLYELAGDLDRILSYRG